MQLWQVKHVDEKNICNKDIEKYDYKTILIQEFIVIRRKNIENNYDFNIKKTLRGLPKKV